MEYEIDRLEYRIDRLDDHTWIIEEYDEETSVYMYLLTGSEQAVLIDAGLGTIPLDQICGELVPYLPTVILTHGHFDHIGGTGLFKRVMLHEEDRDVYREHDRILKENYVTVNAPMISENLTYFNRLTAPEEINLGGRTLQLIHTPGHSHGSICILDRERKWLFTGDTACKAHVLLHMPGGAPVATYAASIKKLIALGDEYTLTWPGHHAKPVAPVILHQFSTAAEGIISGRMVGEATDIGGLKARLLLYQDIGIVY